MIFKPYHYQQFGTNHILENPFAGLFVGMGLGKTVMTLTAIDQLIYDRLEVQKVLVIAPLLVVQEVWMAEVQKWEHLKHLRVAKILGTEQQRKDGMKAKADIYLINVENVVWLIGQLGGRWPYDMVVIDESSKFKNHSSQRFKKLRTMRPKMKRVVALTGTPAPNGLLNLWSQIYLLDKGERLGETIGGYREKYFRGHNEGMHQVYELKKEKEDLIGEDYYAVKIHEKIADICISMEKDDYLDLPKRIDQMVYVDFPVEVRKRYELFERDQVLSFLDREEITAINAAVLMGKLLQFANGAVYNEEKKVIDGKEYYEVHDVKLEVIAEDVEAAIAGGESFLIFYQYQHDRERLMKRLEAYKPEVLTSKNSKTVYPRWNKKEIPVMLAHAASAGHGLNLQFGGHLVGFFGLNYDLELYLQALMRLDRPGQEFPVVNRRYIIRGTQDEKVVAALDGKEDDQQALLNAVKALVKKWKG